MENDSTFTQPAEILGKIKDMSIGELSNLIIKDYLIPLGIKILIAVIVFAIGRALIKFLNKGFEKILVKRNTEASLSSFLKSLISVLLNFILIVAIISILGIDTSSLVALLASAGLAVGMALSGTLQNFAGGVIIMLFRPFRIGDFIEGQGQSGTVKEIQIFNTLIVTPDNKLICIPNGGLSTSVLVNYSKESERRVDWTFHIAYGDDYDKAKALLTKFAEEDSRILKDPAVFIELLNLNDSSVDIVMRAWVKSSDYWAVFFNMNEKVYKQFPSENIHFPYPQMDVHIKGGKL